MGLDGKVGVHFDGSSKGVVSRLEVIEGPSGRRVRTCEERARIAAESLMPGVRVADIARKHGTSRWQVYDWRKQLRSGRLPLPACLSGSRAFAALVVEEPEPPTSNVQAHAIELVVDGVVIRTWPSFDDAHLARVIRVIRAATR